MKKNVKKSRNGIVPQRAISGDDAISFDAPNSIDHVQSMLHYDTVYKILQIYFTNYVKRYKM